jgi:hypothetical protein
MLAWLLFEIGRHRDIGRHWDIGRHRVPLLFRLFLRLLPQRMLSDRTYCYNCQLLNCECGVISVVAESGLMLLDCECILQCKRVVQHNFFPSEKARPLTAFVHHLPPPTFQPHLRTAGADGRDARIVRFGVTQNAIISPTDAPIREQYQTMEDRHGEFMAGTVPRYHPYPHHSLRPSNQPLLEPFSDSELG